VHSADIGRFGSGVFGAARHDDPPYFESKLTQFLGEILHQKGRHLSASLTYLAQDGKQVIICWITQISDPKKSKRKSSIRQLTLPWITAHQLGEHAKHVEERLAGRGARIDRLLSRAQDHASLLQLMDAVLQIPQWAGEPVDARDDKGIAWRRKSSKTCSSVRPSRRVPLAFSARITSQPAALSATRWMPKATSMSPLTVVKATPKEME
jgi:hypothetical protein